MIVDTLIDILTDKYNLPVYRQGSLSADEAYPEEFFTFWNNSTEDHAHYADEVFGIVWDFDLNFYSTDPDRTYSVLSDAAKELKKHGFIIDGNGYDAMSDEPTHTGRGIGVLFLQTKPEPEPELEPEPEPTPEPEDDEEEDKEPDEN